MSGIIPDSILSIDIENVPSDGSGDYYCLISFPEKVVVTGVKFVVNAEMRGSGSNSVTWDRQYWLGAVKGRKSVGVGAEPYYEDIIPFFGDGPKPTVYCGNGEFVSTTVAPIESGIWYSWESYDGNVAQMDPDEYLMLFVEAESGDFETYDQSLAKATIVLSYTGANFNA